MRDLNRNMRRLGPMRRVWLLRHTFPEQWI
jgi:hypothetical protein